MEHPAHEFLPFDGLPWRFRPVGRGWRYGHAADWRRHPSASHVEAMLKERGLDDRDVTITFVDETMLIESRFCVRQLTGDEDAETLAPLLKDFAADLDHIVASLLRDRMIEASRAQRRLRTAIAAGRPDGTASISGATRRETRDPLWAATASSLLVSHIDAQGLSARQLVERIRRTAEPNDFGRSWLKVGDAHYAFENAQLHARFDGDDWSLVDQDGIELYIPDHTMPATAAAAAAGRRLSEVVDMPRPPAILAGLDPRIVSISGLEDYRGPLPTGVRIRLEGGTETLADVPASALAAIGSATRVPRTTKPWLRRDLRADGSRRKKSQN